MPMSVCNVERLQSCSRSGRSAGATMHYMQYRRGQPFSERIRRDEDSCKLIPCGMGRMKDGYCAAHYTMAIRLRKEKSDEGGGYMMKEPRPCLRVISGTVGASGADGMR